MVDNHTSARGIMGLMLPKGPPMKPKGRRPLGKGRRPLGRDLRRAQGQH